jgi:hypothetical protein
VCFSPEADLVAGLAITGIGINALSHIRHRRELPLASIPVLLGVHQLIETLVWWGERGVVSAETGTVAMWAYLIIAFCVLPVMIPAGVMGIEPTAKRRWLMSVMLATGVAVSVVLLVQMVRGPVTVTEQRFHLYYEANLTLGGPIVALYMAAVCVPLLISRYRHVVYFGVANLVAAVFLAMAIQSGFTSIWCAWAAVASAAIALHIRYAAAHRGPPRIVRRARLSLRRAG